LHAGSAVGDCAIICRTLISTACADMYDVLTVKKLSKRVEICQQMHYMCPPVSRPYEQVSQGSQSISAPKAHGGRT
jgi:hypothetical protein